MAAVITGIDGSVGYLVVLGDPFALRARDTFGPSVFHKPF